jgi:cytochrome c551/c552
MRIGNRTVRPPWAALALPALALTAAVLATPLPAIGQAAREPRAALFVHNGCTECHAVSALGLRGATDAGPDLTFAYADVVNRYGTTLEYFLEHPTGVMQMILMSHVQLEPAAQDSIIQVLKELFEQRRAEMDPEMPSAPPLRARAP